MNDKTKCEYCAAPLPLGVDVKTRRIRTAHFQSCPERPKQEEQEHEMNNPPTTTTLDKAVFYIQFEINKHGQCGGSLTVEERVNTLSQFELLQLITEAIDNPPNGA